MFNNLYDNPTPSNLLEFTTVLDNDFVKRDLKPIRPRLHCYAGTNRLRQFGTKNQMFKRADNNKRDNALLKYTVQGRRLFNKHARFDNWSLDGQRKEQSNKQLKLASYDKLKQLEVLETDGKLQGQANFGKINPDKEAVQEAEAAVKQVTTTQVSDMPTDAGDSKAGAKQDAKEAQVYREIAKPINLPVITPQDDDGDYQANEDNNPNFKKTVVKKSNSGLGQISNSRLNNLISKPKADEPETPFTYRYPNPNPNQTLTN